MDFGDQNIVRNVSSPSLLPFPAAAADNHGIAVVIAPGGGFKFLSIDREGTLLARWLNARGINAFVLKYRLDPTACSKWRFGFQVGAMFTKAWWRSLFADSGSLPTSPMSPVQSLAIVDGQAAVRYLREHASQWRIDPNRIGIIGFSAGGAVAHGVALQGTGESRVNFVASVYGVPAIGTVPADASPLLLLHADDDPVVPLDWSQALHAQWQAAGRSAQLHRFETGGHGFGMKTQHTPSDRWPEIFSDWLFQTLNEMN